MIETRVPAFARLTLDDQQELLGHVRVLLEEKHFEGAAGLLMRDTTLYRNMVGITRGADSLMRTLTNGQGTASKLLTDQTLYDQLNKLTTDLGQVLADVRRDPRRYTKGMICVLNCK